MLQWRGIWALMLSCLIYFSGLIDIREDSGVDQIFVARQLVLQRLKVDYFEGFTFSSSFMSKEKDQGQKSFLIILLLMAKIFLPHTLKKRILECYHKWKWSRSVMSDSLWPHGYQAPASMGFSRQEYWSGVPLPSQTYSYLGTNLRKTKNTSSLPPRRKTLNS